MKLRILACSLLSVGALMLAAFPAQAGLLPSDSMTVYDPTGAIFAQKVVFDANEDPTVIYTVPGVPIDPAQYGSATTLLEPNGSYSDIFGVAKVNGTLFLGFSSDTETTQTPYGPQGKFFLPEGNGVFDATMYLDTGLQAQGFKATFISDTDAVPEPASLALMGIGVLAFGAYRRVSRT
jgi:PEP-CTERM motif